MNTPREYQSTPVHLTPVPPVDPLIYNELVEQMKIDPENQMVQAPVPNRRQKRANARASSQFTQRVWDSIRPDGTVDPDLAVPPGIYNTSELPLIEKRGA